MTPDFLAGRNSGLAFAINWCHRAIVACGDDRAKRPMIAVLGETKAACQDEYQVVEEEDDGDGAVMCEECGTYPANLPSKICAGCEAYREHQR